MGTSGMVVAPGSPSIVGVVDVTVDPCGDVLSSWLPHPTVANATAARRTRVAQQSVRRRGRQAMILGGGNGCRDIAVFSSCLGWPL